MPAQDIIKQVYKPSLNVGQVYVKPYGAASNPLPIGNVLELTIEHKEDVQRQDDMTRLGGGTHAEVRRVTEITGSMKLADVNVVNLARAVLGTTQAVDAGTVQGEAAIATRGGLIRLAHIKPEDVVVKKAGTVIAPADYEVRAEGIYLLPSAAGVQDGDALAIDYGYVDQVVIEALTTKAIELSLSFGGLNEADSGNPVVVDIFRLSQGVTKQLSLINSKFGALDVELSIMQDPTRQGTGLSRYYKATMA